MTVYNITYFRKNEEPVDSTQVDENSEELIWDLFKEFGYKSLEGDYYEVEETQDNN